MDQEKLDKLAEMVFKLKADHEILAEQNEAQAEELASFRKRAQAEDILLRSRQAKDAPDGLRAVTIEEFVEKRAMLEAQSGEHIDKVATLIGYLEEGDGLSLSDEMDDSDPSDLTEWLRSQI